MLVKDPNQRYTIEQIKKHKWMQADPAVKTILAYNDEVKFEGDKILDEYNEQALELMQGLGIDIERTKKVSRKSKTFGFPTPPPPAPQLVDFAVVLICLFFVHLYEENFVSGSQTLYGPNASVLFVTRLWSKTHMTTIQLFITYWWIDYVNTERAILCKPS